ncbi:MAG: ATP-dependent RNA helicase dbp7 [Bathelium mastoideum]|nr:MAG: ATP-dependent RNA helicase dbp7 [Bathelium mastoideum]
MADDGLLLNFSVSDAPLKVKPSFTGGRWKDRLTAKKAAANWQRRQSTKPVPEDVTSGTEQQNASSEQGLPDANDRPSKRVRVEHTAVPSNTAHSGHKNIDRRSTESKPTYQSNQFISSLFTSNPTPQKAVVDLAKVSDDTHVEPSNAPLTTELENFTSLGLSSTLASHLTNKLNIRSPTAIQKEAVARLLKEDTDAFLQAETGSGKTLAYILPIVQHLMSLSVSQQPSQEHSRIHRGSGLFALILAPTRELCKQISVVLESLLRCANWIVSGSVAGGESKKSEKARLRKGLNILVATPGRLADHLANTKVLDVGRVRWLVLDEGDRLTELGFERDIQKIISNLNLQSQKIHKSEIPGLPDKRTTILCSATMKLEVQRLKDMSLKSPIHIQVDAAHELEQSEGGKREQDSFSAPAQLKQSYAIIPAKLRLVSLVATLKRAFARKGSVTKAIVFLSCADSVDFHFSVLARESDDKDGQPDSQGNSDELGGSRKSDKLADVLTSAKSSALSKADNHVRIFRLHGGLPQSLRTSTLSSYSRESKPAVLLCTDVASRGLDVPNVDFVIEYDPAFSKDDHLHRIGRTARAGRDGRALLFLMPGEEENYVQILKQGRRDGGLGMAHHDADEVLRKGFSPSSGVSSSQPAKWEDQATEWQLDAERWVQESSKNLEQARQAFQSHVRAYATHVVSERHCFNIKTLHLGHLAKAFALRDKPGSIKVPGLRPGKDEAARSKAERKAKASTSIAKEEGSENVTSRRSEYDIPTATDAQAAARKMRAKMKQMSGASEFNLG